MCEKEGGDTLFFCVFYRMNTVYIDFFLIKRYNLR